MQNFQEIFITAVKALSLQKVRTFLTMLGVVIGVFSVVSLVSLVRGIQNYVTDQFDQLGSNLIFVAPGRASITSDPAASFTDNKLEQKHTDLIIRDVKKDIAATTPTIIAGRTAKYKTKSYYASLSGGSFEFIDVFNTNLRVGRNFTKAEQDSEARVAILGYNVYKELFGNSNSLGKDIKIDNTSFKVVGAMGRKGSDYDEMIIIPYTTMANTLDIKKYSYICIKLNPGTDVNIASKKIEMTLLKSLKRDDFTMMTQQDLLSSVQSILNVLSIGLGAIAGISLLVGGIGIMNIMLVSVTERIREIGLRKALGATSFNIGFQFMIESIVLSVMGGSIGLFLGWLTTFTVQRWFRAEVPIWAILLSLGFSGLVGIIFGTYPAIRASKLDAIEALRYE